MLQYLFTEIRFMPDNFARSCQDWHERPQIQFVQQFALYLQTKRLSAALIVDILEDIHV